MELLKALNYKIPKNQFVITKKAFGEDIYAKVCPICIIWERTKQKATCVIWERTKQKATKFSSEEEAKKEAKKNIFRRFKDELRVIEI